MAAGPEHDIKQLKTLIEATLHSARGYSEAAGGSSKFSAMFRERADQRFEIAERLRTRVKSHGGDPGTSGSAHGAAGQSSANGGKKLSGSDASIIAEVEAAEDQLKELYQKVVYDEELSDPIRTAVESEFAQIQATGEELR